MNKRILLITNPGEPNAGNYCQGVNVDAKNYVDYFLSPLGGHGGNPKSSTSTVPKPIKCHFKWQSL